MFSGRFTDAVTDRKSGGARSWTVSLWAVNAVIGVVVGVPALLALVTGAWVAKSAVQAQPAPEIESANTSDRPGVGAVPRGGSIPSPPAMPAPVPRSSALRSEPQAPVPEPSTFAPGVAAEAPASAAAAEPLPPSSAPERLAPATSPETLAPTPALDPRSP